MIRFSNISVSDAIQAVLAERADFGTETIPLEEAPGRILAEKVFADRDFPPFDRVSMDGIALDIAGFSAGSRTFRIEGLAAAGSPQMTLSGSDQAIEVMTGSVCPKGANAVVRYEDIRIENGVAELLTEDLVLHQNIHLKGRDRSAGSMLLDEGDLLGPGQIGTCAFVGKSSVRVRKWPRILIISSGDELVEIDDRPLDHQIRTSNTPTLLAQLAGMGIKADSRHLSDDADDISEKLDESLSTYDALIISGGVSKGKYDLIPNVLHDLGVEKKFHGVQQRPGKPFWFGAHSSGCKVFAFPGNPISAYVCSLVYFTRWLDASTGSSFSPTVVARLAEEVTFMPNLTYFLEVRIRQDQAGVLWAHPAKGQGSGDLANLLNTDGFIRLEAGQNTYPQGGVYEVYLCRSFHHS